MNAFWILIAVTFWGVSLIGIALLWRSLRAWQLTQLRWEASEEVTTTSETDLRDMHWLRRWLYRAGYRSDDAWTWWLVATIMFVAIGAVVAILLVLSGVQTLMVRTITLVPGGTGEVFLPLAYLAPWFLAITLGLTPWLIVRQRRRDRVQKIEQDLPLAMELLATLSQAGLGFDAALSRVMETRLAIRPLGKELRSYQADVMSGRARSECLRRLAWRADVPGLSILTSALVQADQVGMGISDVLRRQADDLRSRRRERANMFAMGLATKRMFPLVICFLPGLFVWTLGPVFIQLIQMADTFTQVRNF
ncbi:type II secretion system F family protein [Bremerella sp. P1]|uniref:type II secretion system F family protein n=1 Tax=Bremerella sp. P1 TaxID=3026424 RepID=UPI0023682909|nr:type II secretion system F family protein [Bremerella sp. P1]WDI42517.1 type II secretion system F family protein [Bremerella sp. P1]